MNLREDFLGLFFFGPGNDGSQTLWFNITLTIYLSKIKKHIVSSSSLGLNRGEAGVGRKRVNRNVPLYETEELARFHAENTLSQ